eukprot:1175988-Prorocentrum_minimum.AAC.2
MKQLKYVLPDSRGQETLRSLGVFVRNLRWTNRTHEVRVYPYDGPIGRMKCGNILTMDQSDA